MTSPIAVENTTALSPMRKLVQSLTSRIAGRREQRVGRSSRAGGWRLYLIQTKTGQIGPMIDPQTCSWEITLNATETITVKVRKIDLAGIERRWYTPWWGGLLLTWTSDLGSVETPIIAGPIKTWGDETRETLELKGAGLREIYKHLYIGHDLDAVNVSLGEIMWRLAEQVNTKPGGGLNIVDGSPDPNGRDHERHYKTWNLANVGIDKLMGELSNVINGPDVMMRPRYASDPRFIEWQVCHGTSISPRITTADTTTHDFDTTAARASVASIEVSTSAAALVSRVWCTGSGEGSGTRIARAEEPSLTAQGFPFLEEVISDPGATTGENQTQKPADQELRKLRQLAAGELAARVDSIDQITVTVPADHPTRGVAEVTVGDPAKVTLAGWQSIPDGTHSTRVVKMSGDLTRMVTIDFQTDSWI